MFTTSKSLTSTIWISNLDQWRSQESFMHRWVSIMVTGRGLASTVGSPLWTVGVAKSVSCIDGWDDHLERLNFNPWSVIWMVSGACLGERCEPLKRLHFTLGITNLNGPLLMATHYSVGVHPMLKNYSVQVNGHVHFNQMIFLGLIWYLQCFFCIVHNFSPHVSNRMLGVFHK